MGSHAGEFTADMLMPFIDGLIQTARASGELDTRLLHFETDKPEAPPGMLRYPGKVAIDGDRIAVSDSGNHRVMYGSLSENGTRMDLHRVFGGMEAGFANGAAPSFNSPQGLVFSGKSLYVADAANHAVRMIDLDTGETATLAGTGRQLRSRVDRDGRSLSSPWDLAIAGNTLFVAMAGAHQLWAIDLSSKKSRVHSGSGGEDIRDGDNREALLAQPMGIAAFGDKLCFADSESSAIRVADIAADGDVKTLVGTGLFDFGDADGIGDEVLMQHQQGVSLHSSGRMLIADSYNDSVKWLDPMTRSAATWIGGLHEPGGVACGSSHAYVADTNAHRIVAIDYETGALAALSIGKAG